MFALNDGLLEVYSVNTSKDAEKNIIHLLSLEKKMWFTFLVMRTDEYYLDKQSQSKLEKRVRVHRDRSISSQNVVVLEGKQYKVGRVAHGFTKEGIQVTDISLERVEVKYAIE